MDFQALKEKLPRDKQLPQRAFDINALTRVLDGSLYDHLEYPFDAEQDEDNEEYVPVSERRPSVRSGLCAGVVEDSVALLFSEGHFPTPLSDDESTAEALQALIKETSLNLTMIDAATWGSVGSVVVWFRVLKNSAGKFRPFFKALKTEFLTPFWKANEPDKLEMVREQYKIAGQAVRDLGYAIADDDLPTAYWFRREWDEKQERWFKPWRVLGIDGKPDNNPVVDEGKTVDHGLGFVPMVWVKNLPGGDDTDGACTFKAAIDTMIEIDYLASQGGRGLKYASDPTLIIKEPPEDLDTINRTAAEAIVVTKDGDAKLLEMTGNASEALVGWLKMLRQMALESVHGNRAEPDKMSTAQSGRAMELLHQSLIWLADKLRISYGEGALLDLFNMVVATSQSIPITINGKDYKNLGAKPVTLKWAAWFQPTNLDKQAIALTLKTHADAGHISRKTAVETIAPIYDIEDVEAEIAAIEKETAERMAAAQKSQVTATISE